MITVVEKLLSERFEGKVRLDAAGEPLPDEPFALAVRLAAFALVIGAAALTPPPVRAAAPA